MTASPAPTISIVAADRVGRNVLGRRPGNAPTMPCSASVTKTGWPVRAARSGGMPLHRVDPDDRGAGHPCELGGVHLEAHGREIAQAAAAVGQHDQARDWLQGRGEQPLLHEIGHDAGFGQVDLVEQDDASTCSSASRRGGQLARVRGGVGVQFLESSRFSSRGGRPGSITSGLQ